MDLCFRYLPNSAWVEAYGSGILRADPGRIADLKSSLWILEVSGISSQSAPITMPALREDVPPPALWYVWP